ncbi:MAG: hypothetical protein PVI57_05780 [Gemmatimonadota bacterium]
MPDDFVPPVPEWKDPCCDIITMKKAGEDQLIYIERLGNALTIWRGLDPTPAVEEDFFRVAGNVRQPDGTYSDGHERQYFLKCGYNGARAGKMTTYTMWHLERPSWASEEYLLSRHRRHPLIFIGGPVEFCPGTEAEAISLFSETANRLSGGG